MAKDGTVALTIAMKHICRVLDTWSTKAYATIDAAVVAGTITSDQATTLKAWLGGALAACEIIRLVTGY